MTSRRSRREWSRRDGVAGVEGRGRYGARSMPARKSVAIRGLGDVALVPPAALAVHQLRFLLAYGGGAGADLQRTGHSYLHSVIPWLVALIALSAGGFLRALGRAFSGNCTLRRYSISFLGLWLTCTGVLVTLFVCQELLEGIFATGHPAGLVGVFGYGGWWSVPASICLGLVLAAWFHGARWILAEVQRKAPRRWTAVPGRAPGWLAAHEARLPGPALLAGGVSQRGPPRLRS